jgi:integrase
MAFLKVRPGKNGDRYYVYWRPTPGANQKAKVFHDRAEAEAFLLERDGAAPDPSAIPFSKFWTRYIAERATKKLTPKVLGTYTRIGTRLLVPFFAEKPLSSITRSDIPAWITWAEHEAGPGSVQKAYTVLTSCLSYATNLDLIQVNPARGWGDHLPRVERKRERPHLSTAEVKKLADSVDVVFRAMLLSMGILGLRPSEAIALRVGDLDLERKELLVHRAAVDVDGKMVARDTTKTGRDRRVPLMGLEDDFGAHLIERFSLWGQEPPWDLNEATREHANELLFTSKFSRNGGLINLAALSKLVREAGKRIGVKGLSSSDLRHSANANIIELTLDVTFASRVLGNSPEINLRHYDAGTTTRWTEAMRRMSEAWAAA